MISGISGPNKPKKKSTTLRVIRTRVSNAEALPFADDSFDAVVCSFGILHFARPEQAIAETHRVLRTGGHFAFTAWSPPEKSPYFANFLGAVAEYGDTDVSLPEGPPIFTYGDSEECKRSLAACCFTDMTHTELPLVVRVNNEDEVLTPLYCGSVRSRGLLMAQGDEKRERIHQAAIEGAKRYRRGNVIEMPLPALLTAARKP